MKSKIAAAAMIALVLSIASFDVVQQALIASVEDCGLNPNCQSDGHPGSPNE